MLPCMDAAQPLRKAYHLLQSRATGSQQALQVEIVGSACKSCSNHHSRIANATLPVASGLMVSGE
jgi:hypothetical protein